MRIEEERGCVAEELADAAEDQRIPEPGERAVASNVDDRAGGDLDDAEDSGECLAHALSSQCV